MCPSFFGIMPNAVRIPRVAKKDKASPTSATAPGVNRIMMLTEVNSEVIESEDRRKSLPSSAKISIPAARKSDSGKPAMAV